MAGRKPACCGTIVRVGTVKAGGATGLACCQECDMIHNLVAVQCMRCMVGVDACDGVCGFLGGRRGERVLCVFRMHGKWGRGLTD